MRSIGTVHRTPSSPTYPNPSASRSWRHYDQLLTRNQLCWSPVDTQFWKVMLNTPESIHEDTCPLPQFAACIALLRDLCYVIQVSNAAVSETGRIIIFVLCYDSYFQHWLHPCYLLVLCVAEPSLVAICSVGLFRLRLSWLDLLELIWSGLKCNLYWCVNCNYATLICILF
jgi:hypothetical protein